MSLEPSIQTSSSRFEPHSHSMYSNLRLLDCINKPKDLIDRAIELGLSGIALTDHECLSGHVKVNQYAQEIKEKYPDFKVALGNEIYLCPNRDMNQKYYHFILIAKNRIGYKALRELSSLAWMNSYFDRGMERVVTTYEDLARIVNKYPNSLIASTACMGGLTSSKALEMINYDKTFALSEAKEAHDAIVEFILFCQRLFGEDFLIECAPGCSLEQIEVNKKLKNIAECFNCKMIVGTDSHYLKKEDRYVHEAYLTSKPGEREVGSFYEYAYLQTNEEIIENLLKSDFSTDFIKEMFQNSMEIYDKIENFSLFHKQTIPRVEVKNYPKSSWWGINNPDADEMSNYPILKSMFTSDDKVERYWVNQCWEALEEKVGPWHEHLDYVARLEEEADTKRVIGQKLETNMFSYPVTLQHYTNLFWDCGSLVGAGRGSSCAGLNHFLLDITQLDPIEWKFPWFRYMNKERVELGSLWLILPSCK